MKQTHKFLSPKMERYGAASIIALAGIALLMIVLRANIETTHMLRQAQSLSDTLPASVHGAF